MATLRALTSVPAHPTHYRVGHDQNALVEFARHHPTLLDHADGSLFRLDDTLELARLVGYIGFVEAWADVSTRGMPVYFIDYPQVVERFAEAMAYNIHRLYGTVVNDHIWEKLVAPLPADVQTRWVRAVEDVAERQSGRESSDE